MNANRKKSLSLSSVGDPFLWLSNYYLLLIGGDLPSGFDATQWGSPEIIACFWNLRSIKQLLNVAQEYVSNDELVSKETYLMT